MSRRLIVAVLCALGLLLAPALASENQTRKPLQPVEYTLYLRERYENKLNYDFNPNSDDKQDWIGPKWRLGSKFNGTDANGWLELLYSKKDLSTNASADIYQAFAELGKRTKYKLGRQELKYGDGYLISPSSWSNTGRSFDAVLVKTAQGRLKADGFASQLVKYHGSPSGENQFFHGIYTTSTFSKSLALDCYALNKTVAAGGVGKSNLNFYTLGLRAFGTKGKFDYTADVITQFGDNGNKKQQASGAYLNCGYTLPVFWQPRLGAEYTYASGDKDPNDGTVNTFDSLYGTTHNFCGYMDLVGLKNIKDTQFGLDIVPLNRVTLAVDYHIFKLDQAKDAFYGTSKVLMQDPTGAWGTDIGNELDFTCYYRLQNMTWEAGYYTFYPGAAVKAVKGPNPGMPNMFYVSVEYRM